MKRLWLALAAAAVVAGVAIAQTLPPSWIKPAAPVKIGDNLYYVGSEGLAAYLIVTPKGLILIDGTMEQNVPAIEANIRALGFKLSDVDILLNTHAHFDHAAGLARLKKDTGAGLLASAGDKPLLERGVYPGSEDVAWLRFPPVKVDHVLKDRDTVTLGGVTLTAHVTPGHTPGCTTWTFPVKIDGVVRKAIILCSTTVAANRLAPRPQYPVIVADYQATFTRLAGMKADVFLAPHPEQFGFAGKLAARAPGKPSPFVDPAELGRRVAASRAEFEAELARQQKAAP
ncbi:MAG: subclass B3 metallo-beta-lactamase [Caulobacterales bacterium]|nr:subclass B3 metallo-beta-lactamase [Caulobacterales bacterium]